MELSPPHEADHGLTLAVGGLGVVVAEIVVSGGMALPPTLTPVAALGSRSESQRSLR
jgi:hypothetical protein